MWLCPCGHVEDDQNVVCGHCGAKRLVVEPKREDAGDEQQEPPRRGRFLNRH